MGAMGMPEIIIMGLVLIMLVLPVCAGMALVRWWVSSREKHVAKRCHPWEAGQVPGMPARTDLDHEIALFAEGFSITSLRAPSAEVVSVCWDAVVAATAYKRDLWSTDQVCIAFELSNGTFVEVHERMKGWVELCSAMPAHLPGAPRWEQWFMNMTSPAFESNTTLLFQRSASTAP